MKVRTRFSPSPTGRIHLGNARAALFGALYAAKHSGVFILRIEDTDRTRSEEQYSTLLQEDLHWLGVFWQEGPGEDGQYGPYWQSQRQAIYDNYYQILEAKQLIYPCFCTDQELLLARKAQISQGIAPRYAGTCGKLSAEEIAARISKGKKPAWRFSVPANTDIEFVDMVKGPQYFRSDDIGDFIIRRADGTPPFLFCNAIDDATMHVSHVLRGEDHLANTPRQLMLLQALDLNVPEYGHLSLIVGEDGAPLSKRHGSFSLQEMQDRGYLPIAIMNYLSRLGHSSDLFSLAGFNELAQHFQLEKLSRSPARFDENQLRYWQKTAVLALDIPGLWRWMGEEVERLVPENKRDLFAETIKSNVEFPNDALEWARIFFQESIDISAEFLPVLIDAGEQFFVEAEQAFDANGMELQAVLADMKKTLGISGKKLFMPLRIALTGKVHGPELAQITEILGIENVKKRLGEAFKLSGNKSGG